MRRSIASFSCAVPFAIALMASGAKADTLSASSFSIVGLGLTQFVTFTSSVPSIFGTGNNPTSTIGYAGAIRLNNVTTNPTSILPAQGSSLIAFCVELTQFLQAPATWEAITQTSVIGGLITNYSATPSVNVGGGVIYDDVRDLGAAFQIAIWSQVYTGVTYTVNAALLHEVGATDANFHTLVNMITAAALPADWRKLTSPFPNTAFPNNNQDLGVVLPNPSVGVPGPLAGAGLPGLFAACAGLLLLARRRRQKLA